MRHILCLVMTGVLATSLAFGATAQQTTVDLSKIDSQLAAQILEAQKKGNTIDPKTMADQAKEWAGVGKAVGDGIGATARALSIEVNDFIKTPVGKWTFFFLFWYIIGHKMWSVFAGIAIWV